ncbi:putative kinase-like protein TMKL1 isoform X2 [Salvia miltiorrhiza]|uniref:putative kinase-like protein TMKL1 isoform X2 n=1 Tax=Salvia miltiorrhiza TaxID=226208 RepID=UPI0025AC13FE|nr:putative kinase-like protein TMKL1 isoform X2 [Salvia miltiorrhiza]
MEHKHKLILLATLTPLSLLTIIFLAIFCFRRRKSENDGRDVESKLERKGGDEDLVKFEGGEDLSVVEILEAPGEVIGKSSYGTLYKANLVNLNCVTLLRFLRPTCTLRIEEVMPAIELLGSVRHPNLVPLNAFYAGPRGEKLMVLPFYSGGNLADFIRDSNGEVYKWTTICRISIGIARGVHHLHTALNKPIVHGNLKSKNILLGADYHPYVSDFGVRMVLNPATRQKMVEASGFEGYKAPELIKMKDVSEESDVYSLGIIFLELLSGKEAVNESDQDSYLPGAMTSAVLDDRLKDLYHPNILVGLSNDERVVTEDDVLRYFQLAMACCSPTQRLRPNMKQILDKLEEMGK